MKILTLLGFLVLLTTSQITNCIQEKLNAVSVPTYLQAPVAGSSSFGSYFGFIECPSGYTTYSENCGQFCYRFESQHCSSWSDARAFCQKEGADLWVPDECSYSYFQGLAKQKAVSCNGFWIGGFRVPPTNDYMTLSGAALPVNFKFWASGQPDRLPRNPGVDACVLMSNEFNFLMSDDLCLDLAGYMCRKNI